MIYFKPRSRNIFCLSFDTFVYTDIGLKNQTFVQKWATAKFSNLYTNTSGNI